MSTGPQQQQPAKQPARQSSAGQPAPRGVPTVTEPVKATPKKVYAGPCPVNKDHKKRRVYSKSGNARYCVCDDCGKTWKQTPESGEDAGT